MDQQMKWRKRPGFCSWPGCRTESSVKYQAGATVVNQTTSIEVCDKHITEVGNMVEECARKERDTKSAGTHES